MVAHALIDTGPIVALLRRDDPWHLACRAALEQLRTPLLTSDAVLAEVFHFLGGDSSRLEAAWRFLRSGTVTLGPITDADLPSLDALMGQYQDRPMDFADATLVHLAHRESLATIFTIDHDDFETYRIPGGRRFRMVPGTPAVGRRQ